MKKNNKKYADTHLRNVCPILTSESSGGTGFFYKSGESVYLMTVKHNVIPGRNEYADGVHLDMGEDYSPRIEVLLRSPSNETWLGKEIDMRDRHVFFKECFGAIAIPVSFDPEDYNYVVYDSQDIQSVDNIEDRNGDLLFIGYDSGSFSRWNSDNIDYTDPGQPRMVFSSDPRGVDDCYGRVSDVDEVRDYGGMSGAPLLADGVVGIHISNLREDLFFTRAEAIPEILEQPRRIEERNPMESFEKNVLRNTAEGGSG